MTGLARVSIPRTETSWLTSEGLRSRMTLTSARLNGFEETLTSARVRARQARDDVPRLVV